MTPRQKRRQALAEAVRVHARKLAGAYTRQGRAEWAASRRAEGWSTRLVLDAISAGSLASVRQRMDSSHSETPPPPRVERAVQALSLIDTQRELATRRGRYLKAHVSSRPPD
jgi:hypothetical protein